MNENTNTAINDTQTAGVTAGQNEPVFTQDELNRILGDRLHKERQKIENELAEREKAVTQKEYHTAALDVLKKYNAHQNTSEPLEILSVLNATTAEELDRAMAIIHKAVAPTYETRGFTPHTPPNNYRQSRDEDADIRKAMGLKE